MEACDRPPKLVPSANAQFPHHHHQQVPPSYAHLSAPQPSSSLPECAIMTPQPTDEYLVPPDPSTRPAGIEYSSFSGTISANPAQIALEAAYQALYSYAQDAQNQQVLLTKESIQLYGMDPMSYANVASSQGVGDPNAAAAAAAWNQTYAAFSNSFPKKVIKKKNKVVQSAYCAVCKIDCNSKDVLDKHISGKKHLKNIKKLQESKKEPPKLISPSPEKVGPMASSAEALKPKPGVVEDLETKRRKVLEGGAAAAEVRVCTLCDTVCNSQTVFNFHLTGKNHAAQLKKMAEAGAVAGA